MWRYVHTDELYHYGVPGMKWGVHRSKNYNGPTMTIGSKKRNVTIGFRAFDTKGANKRKAAANKAVKQVNKTAPGSKRYVKTKIKADKINASRYGKTNGRILAEGALKIAGTKLVTDVAKKTAYRRGKEITASLIERAGQGLMIAEGFNTSVRLAANYRDKNRKNR